ncbi:MAG: hypothetical protein JKY37_10130 [Nannocystaceae bacterium]|nr:hypothetical protein [Nannocystaceae bacterium]
MATRFAVLCVALAGCTFGGSGVGSDGGSLASGTSTHGTADNDGDGESQSQTGQTPGDSGGVSASADGTAASADTGAGTTTGGEQTDVGGVSTDTGVASDEDTSDEDTSEDSDADCDPPTTACLSTTSLLARYYLDEAGDGAAVGTVMDWASKPLDLELESDPNINYVTVNGHRGLEWLSVGGNGVAHSPIAGTKLAQLHGATTATLELVVNLDAADNGARLIHFGSGSQGGLLTLRMEAIDSLHFRWKGEIVDGIWDHDFSSGRVVVHFVLDTTEGDGDARRRLYIDGAQVAASTDDAPDQGETISVDNTNDQFALGNRANGGKAIDGILFYAAIYAGALDDETIATNAEILLVDDDRP